MFFFIFARQRSDSWILGQLIAGYFVNWLSTTEHISWQMDNRLFDVLVFYFKRLTNNEIYQSNGVGNGVYMLLFYVKIQFYLKIDA
jgi:hypothetical protein